ncbi:MAG: competence protein ComEC [Candidatus Azotimanducaceae bacterium]|jgi:competence protein ComEC
MGVALFYTAAIGFAGGILMRSFFDIGLPEIVWVLTVSLVLGVIWARRSEASSGPYLLMGSVFLFLFALGLLRFEYSSWHEINTFFESKLESEVALVGTIVREPDVRESNTHLYVAVDDELLLVTVDRYENASYGDEVTIEGVLAQPESFETDLGRTFNYLGYLRARGVNYVVKFGEVEVVGSGHGNYIFAGLLDFKHSFMRSIESLLPEPHVGLSEGLLLGVKRALGSQLEEVFRKTGIIHIVVLSGYNVMLVVMFVTYILAFLIPFRARIVFGLLAITAFALMVGLSATVVRASIMASLILVAKATNRTYMVIRALLLAGVIMLIINPYLLAFDTGFQLSFVATLGLIFVAPHLEKKLTLMPKTIGMREFLTATLATQLFVMPILLYQIGEFSVVSVLVNVLVLPMVPVAMLLTFITGLVGFVSSTLALPLSYLTYFSLEYILRVATFFADLPFASYIVPVFPFWVVPVSYGLIGYVLWKLWKREVEPVEVTTEAATTNESDELAGWVIEEEEVVRKRLAAEERSSSAARCKK